MPVVRTEAVRDSGVDNDIDVRAPQRCLRVQQLENGVESGGLRTNTRHPRLGLETVWRIFLLSWI